MVDIFYLMEMVLQEEALLGGGSINIFVRNEMLINEKINADGGNTNTGKNGAGGSGGKGSITITTID